MLIFPVDYNSWQESEKGLRLAASLDRDVVLAEGMSLSPLPYIIKIWDRLQRI